MKKNSKKSRRFFLKHEIQRKRKEKKNSRLRKNRLYKQKLSLRDYQETNIEKIKKFRRSFRADFYKPIRYEEKSLDILIDNEFGIENDFKKFIELASTFTDSRSRELDFNLKNCTRLWPSAITLLCSFKQWTEITASGSFKPILSSTMSDSDDVNQYLEHSGFFDYVRISHSDDTVDIYDDSEIVKIKRENNSSEIDDREDEIRELIEKYSDLTDEQVEVFDDRVLIEAFNNVDEHGFSNRDSGWWTITQYHKKTGIISLCIADNGIGIKNSLLTGPQRKQLLNRLGSSDDSDYICAALEENVSGAITGSVKESGVLFSGGYLRGSRRGNGLKRIKEACKECGVVFSLLSQKGYIQIGADGKVKLKDSSLSRVFAGTLYHFSIPAKKIA